MGEKKKRIRKKTLRHFAAGFLLTFAGLSLWVALAAPQYIKKNINRYVIESSHGEYELHFSDIKANLYTQVVRIDSIRLVPLKTNQTHYSFAAKQLKASGISVFDFLFHGKLNIDLLQLVKPEFEIFGGDGQKRDAPDKEQLFRKLKPFFNSQMKAVSIGEIKLEQAHVAHYRLKDQSIALNSIKNLDIGIRKFKMDSALLSKNQEFFKADDIYLKIIGFSRMLGDSIHRLKVDTLTYSIENNSIYGSNLQLEPVDSTNQRASLYWLSVPRIKLKSKDLRDILGNDSVRIDTVDIRNSIIRVRPRKDAERLNFKKLEEYNLYKLIENDFNVVNIRHFHLQADRLDFEAKDPDLNAPHQFKNIDIVARNFQLDSMAYNKSDKVLYADSFDLKIGSCSLNLNDRVHIFTANDIEVSGSDSLIKAGQIQLIPQANGQKLPVTVQMQCDSIRFLKVNLSHLFHLREMPLSEISLFNPQIFINQYAHPDIIHQDEQSLLYQFIGSYIKGVYANVISIEKGHIEINDLRNKTDDGHIETDFNFKLTDFSLDSVSARKSDKLFFATNLELNFSNYKMQLADQLHILHVADIHVSSLQRLATIRQLHLFPDKSKDPGQLLRHLNRSELYDVKIPLLSLRNTDIHHAFFRKQLNINSFTITRPHIYFEVFAQYRHHEKELNLDEFYDLVKNYITQINISHISVNDGELRLVNHTRKGKTTRLTNSFSANLEQFRLNDDEMHSGRMLFSDSFDLKIKDHLFRLSDNVHYLKASEITFSSKSSSGTIQNAVLYPDISSPDFTRLPWHIQVNIPNIRLNQIDLQKALFNEVLDVGSVEIDSPVIQLYQYRKGDGKFNFKDLTIPLPEELKELTLGKVSLKSGKLLVYKSDDRKNEQLAGSEVNFELKNARLKRTENNKTARFSSESIETNLSNLTLTPTKIPLTINVNRIHFSSIEKKLLFKGLLIKNTGDFNQQITSISMPDLQFEQLDPSEAFDQNRFHASRILVNDPVFTFRQRESEQKRNPLYIKLPSDFNSLMDELSAEQVVVNNATFTIQKKKETLRLEHVDIAMNHVLLNSTLSEKPLGAKDLTLVRRNIQYTDENRLYDLLIDRFEYSSKGNELSLNGIHVIPRYNQDRFQQLISYQQDYYSGDIHQITFWNINLDRWFENHEFTGKNIDIDQVNLLIYRDKRKPFNPRQYPPMPQDLMRRIELPFCFDTVKLSNSTVIYTEQLDEIPEPGRVSFEKLNARLYPFTNIGQLQLTHPDMRLNASAMLMGASELKARLQFDMNSPVNRFEAKGSLRPFDLTAMNPITENGASISVRSGQLNRFEFEFSGDSIVANGKLRFAYEDLKIYLLAHKNGNTKEAKFLSFLANSLMLRSKSPRTKILLPDDIHYRRDPNKSTLNYWWKSVFSGAKNTFGVKDE